MRHVLVTGASSGVGAATARAFAAAGDRVTLVARSTDRLAALASELGPGAVSHPCDASDAAAVDAMAQRVLAEAGPPDVIVHCAGAGQWKRVEETSAEEALAMMHAPYFAAFTVTRAFLPAMLERGSGVIQNVNSPACIAPWPSSVGYAAARFALRGFHEALAQDLADTGLHSCHVIFGRITSAYFENNPGTDERFPAFGRMLPTLTPEACARVLVRLADRPRHQTVKPAILRVALGIAIVMPGLSRWLLRL